MTDKTEVIRSRQNRSVVELVKLSDRKNRREQGLFRFDGLKLFGEAIRAGVEIVRVFLRESDASRLQNEAMERYGEAAARAVQAPILLDDDLFDRISEEKSPEGMICVAKYIDKFKKIVTIYNSTDFSHFSGERILLLEAVRDPSNLGAVVRSAAAMGVDRIIISSDCADVYHPKTLRASMGAVFHMQIDAADDLPAIIRQLKQSGRRLFAAALDESAVRLGRFSVRESDCVVIGNEGHGLSCETLRACGESVFIPMSNRVESFNAAVAASILMWEFFGRSGSDQ